MSLNRLLLRRSTFDLPLGKLLSLRLSHSSLLILLLLLIHHHHLLAAWLYLLLALCCLLLSLQGSHLLLAFFLRILHFPVFKIVGLFVDVRHDVDVFFDLGGVLDFFKSLVVVLVKAEVDHERLSEVFVFLEHFLAAVQLLRLNLHALKGLGQLSLEGFVDGELAQHAIGEQHDTRNFFDLSLAPRIFKVFINQPFQIFFVFLDLFYLVVDKL